MLYELRVYEVVPGKIGALNDRFANITLKFFDKYGIKALGFWTPAIGTSGQLIYLVEWQSLAQREEVWDRFVVDPDWSAARAKTEEHGPIVARVINSILKPTSYFPRVVDPLPQKRDSGTNIYELRVYEVLPGRMQALNDRFANISLRKLREHGFRLVGFWETAIGTGGQLTYMVKWQSHAERDAGWEAMNADPEWQAAAAKSVESGQILSRIVNTILVPTSYSAMR